MLAISTCDSLILIDQPLLKCPPSSLSPTCSLEFAPTCSIWSPDNRSLFVSSSTQLFQYDCSGKLLAIVYSSPPDRALTAITALVSKDRGNTVIFSQGQQIHILETHSGRIVQTFDSHKAAVTSLALSNDSSLLATTSAAAVHVHNLSHGSHTVLRGLPAGSGPITTCAFHPHSRTRLLVGAGTQLLVYDTTRPSGPVKAIALSKEKNKNLGEVVSISSSPFSKTLVAVACSGGTVSLVDLEKEKALCRTLSFHVPLTSLVFSPDGATLYAGTENGKVLIQDLRSLDKGPKSITVSDKGDRIVATCIQKKFKPEDAPENKPLVPQDVNKNPARRAPASTGAVEADKKAAAALTKSKVTSRAAIRAISSKGTPSKGRVVSSSPRPARARGAAAKSPVAKRTGNGGVARRVFSPPKSPLPRTASTKEDLADDLNVSVRIENLLALPAANKVKENVAPTKSVPEAISGTSAPAAITGTSRASSRQSTRTDGKTRNKTSISRASVSTSTTSSRVRSVSGSSAGTSASAAGRVSKSSSGSFASRRSPVPPVPAVPAAYTARQAFTSSPELPDVDTRLPVTPLPQGKRKGKERMGGMGVLGLGTPEVDRWIRAGDGRESAKVDEDRIGSKKVGFANRENDEFADDDGNDDDIEVGRGMAAPRDGTRRLQPDLAMQLSPRRAIPGVSSTWATVASPLGNLSNPHPESPRTHAAANLLQTLLRDAMYDFRQETRTELVGLHLDMIRMGRGLRTELRSVVDEFRGEISALQEENKRLREENERLKRGY